MKVIFLDFDGVLNNTGSFILGRYRREKLHSDEDIFANPDPVNVALIDRLLDGNENIKLVISSAWRKMPLVGQSVANLQDTLRELFGLRNWQRVIAMTENQGIRGVEIANWMQDFGQQVDRYCIIDDNDDFLEYQKPFFVQTNFDRGFGWPEYLEAKRILRINKQEPVI